MPRPPSAFAKFVEGFEAAPLAEVGIQSLATDADAFSADHGNFRVARGYARLAEHLHARATDHGAQLRLRSPVTRVAWRENGPISLQLEAGSARLAARLGIVTVPLGVLQADASAGGLAFEPEITAWRAQLKRLGMGHACRVVFEFRGTLALRSVPNAAFIRYPNGLFETFWSQYGAGHTLWTAWAGGPKAQELARQSAEQRKRFALGSLATLFDLPEATLSEQLLAVHQHDFSNDPRARGAYSFCRPDGSKASQALTAPLGNALFLAGEATDHDYPGTVAGAIASGQRAARQALRVLTGDPA